MRAVGPVGSGRVMGARTEAAVLLGRRIAPIAGTHLVEVVGIERTAHRR